MSSGWEPVTDDETGETYYQKGDETSWEPWLEDPSVWDIFQDDEGEDYYYNTLTEESTYDRPEVLPAPAPPAPAPAPVPVVSLPPPTLPPPPRLPVGIPPKVNIPPPVAVAAAPAKPAAAASAVPKGPVIPDSALLAKIRDITAKMGASASPDDFKRGSFELRSLLFAVYASPSLEQACAVASSSVLGIICTHLPRLRNMAIDCSETLDLLILILTNIASASNVSATACDELDELLSSNTIAFARNLIACCLKWKDDADICHKTMTCVSIIAGQCSIASPKAPLRRKALVAGSLFNAAMTSITRWKARGEASADAIAALFYSKDRNEVSSFITALESQKPAPFSTLILGAARSNPASKPFLNCLRALAAASILVQRMNEARFLFDQALEISPSDSTTYLSYALTIPREDRRYPDTVAMCRSFADKQHPHSLERVEMDLTEYGKFTCSGCNFPIQMNRFTCSGCDYHRCANCHHFLTG